MASTINQGLLPTATSLDFQCLSLSLSLSESPTSDLTVLVSESTYSSLDYHLSSVFDMNIPKTMIGLLPASTSLACQRPSCSGFPVLDPTYRLLHPPSVSHCSVLKLVIYVITSGLFTPSYSLACQCLSLSESSALDFIGLIFDYYSVIGCSVLKLVPPAASLACHYLSLSESPASDLTTRVLETNYPSLYIYSVFELTTPTTRIGLVPSFASLAYQHLSRSGSPVLDPTNRILDPPSVRHCSVLK